MKKLVILAMGLMLFITGCGKESEEDLIAKFEKNVEKCRISIVKTLHLRYNTIRNAAKGGGGVCPTRKKHSWKRSLRIYCKAQAIHR